MTRLQLVTAPTLTPVTFEEAKEHVGIPLSDTLHDGILRDILKAAVKYIEDRTDRSFINTTWREGYDRFPAVFEPKRSPLVSVTSITYVDVDGASQTVTASDYIVDTISDPGRVTRAYEVIWPGIRIQTNSVQITYVAGYGATASAVKAAAPQVCQAIKLLVAHWFDNPEIVAPPGSMGTELPHAVSALIGHLSSGELV